MFPGTKTAEPTIIKDDLLCENHTVNAVGFCNTEKIAICAQCLNDSCRYRHDVIDLLQAGALLRSNIIQSHQYLIPIEQKLSNMILLLNETHKEFQKIGNQTLNDILSFFNGVRETIFQYQTKIIEYWKAMFEEEMSLLNEQEIKINSQLTDIDLINREIANLEQEVLSETVKKARYRYGLIRKAAKDVSFRQRMPNLPEFRNDKAFLALWKRLRSDYGYENLAPKEKVGKREISPAANRLDKQKKDVEFIEELFRGTTATAHITKIVQKAFDKMNQDSASDSQTRHEHHRQKKSPGKKWLSEKHLLDHLRKNTPERSSSPYQVEEQGSSLKYNKLGEHMNPNNYVYEEKKYVVVPQRSPKGYSRNENNARTNPTRNDNENRLGVFGKGPNRNLESEEEKKRHLEFQEKTAVYTEESNTSRIQSKSERERENEELFREEKRQKKGKDDGGLGVSSGQEAEREKRKEDKSEKQKKKKGDGNDKEGKKDNEGAEDKRDKKKEKKKDKKHEKSKKKVPVEALGKSEAIDTEEKVTEDEKDRKVKVEKVSSLNTGGTKEKETNQKENDSLKEKNKESNLAGDGPEVLRNDKEQKDDKGGERSKSKSKSKKKKKNRKDDKEKGKKEKKKKKRDSSKSSKSSSASSSSSSSSSSSRTSSSDSSEESREEKREKKKKGREKNSKKNEKKSKSRSKSKEKPDHFHQKIHNAKVGNDWQNLSSKSMAKDRNNSKEKTKKKKGDGLDRHFSPSIRNSYDFFTQDSEIPLEEMEHRANKKELYAKFHAGRDLMGTDSRSEGSNRYEFNARHNQIASNLDNMYRKFAAGAGARQAHPNPLAETKIYNESDLRTGMLAKGFDVPIQFRENPSFRNAADDRLDIQFKADREEKDRIEILSREIDRRDKRIILEGNKTFQNEGKIETKQDEKGYSKFEKSDGSEADRKFGQIPVGVPEKREGPIYEDFRKEGFMNEGLRKEGFINEGFRNEGFKNEGFRNEGLMNEAYKIDHLKINRVSPHNITSGGGLITAAQRETFETNNKERPQRMLDGKSLAKEIEDTENFDRFEEMKAKLDLQDDFNIKFGKADTGKPDLPKQILSYTPEKKPISKAKGQSLSVDEPTGNEKRQVDSKEKSELNERFYYDLKSMPDAQKHNPAKSWSNIGTVNLDSNGFIVSEIQERPKLEDVVSLRDDIFENNVNKAGESMFKVEAPASEISSQHYKREFPKFEAPTNKDQPVYNKPYEISSYANYIKENPFYNNSNMPSVVDPNQESSYFQSKKEKFLEFSRNLRQSSLKNSQVSSFVEDERLSENSDKGSRERLYSPITKQSRNLYDFTQRSNSNSPTPEMKHEQSEISAGSNFKGRILPKNDGATSGNIPPNNIPFNQRRLYERNNEELESLDYQQFTLLHESTNSRYGNYARRSPDSASHIAKKGVHEGSPDSYSSSSYSRRNISKTTHRGEELNEIKSFGNEEPVDSKLANLRTDNITTGYMVDERFSSRGDSMENRRNVKGADTGELIASREKTRKKNDKLGVFGKNDDTKEGPEDSFGNASQLSFDKEGFNNLTDRNPLSLVSERDPRPERIVDEYKDERDEKQWRADEPIDFSKGKERYRVYPEVISPFQGGKSDMAERENNVKKSKTEYLLQTLGEQESQDERNFKNEREYLRYLQNKREEDLMKRKVYSEYKKKNRSSPNE